MKIKTLLIPAFIAVGNLAFGQNLTSAEVETLKEFNKSLIKKEQTHYEDMIDQLYLSSKSMDLKKDFVKVIDNFISNSSELNRIANLVNPSSTELTGKSYNDYIHQIAKDIFVESASSNDKGRFTQILANLTSNSNNPQPSVAGGIIKAALSLTPVSALVGNVISSASSWFNTVGNGKIKEINSAFKEDKLKQFYNQLKPYTEFYDQALALNKKLDEEYKSYVKEADHYQKEYDSAQQKFLITLTNAGVNPQTVTTNALRLKYPFDLKTSISGEYDQGLKDLIDQANHVDEIVRSHKQLYQEADKSLAEYLFKMEELASIYSKQLPEITRLNEIPRQTKATGISLGAKISSNSSISTLNTTLLPIKSLLNVEEIKSLSSRDSDPGMPVANVIPKSNLEMNNKLKTLDANVATAIYDNLNVDYYSIKLK